MCVCLPSGGRESWTLRVSSSCISERCSHSLSVPLNLSLHILPRVVVKLINHRLSRRQRFPCSLRIHMFDHVFVESCLTCVSLAGLPSGVEVVVGQCGVFFFDWPTLSRQSKKTAMTRTDSGCFHRCRNCSRNSAGVRNGGAR